MFWICRMGTCTSCARVRRDSEYGTSLRGRGRASYKGLDEESGSHQVFAWQLAFKNSTPKPESERSANSASNWLVLSDSSPTIEQLSVAFRFTALLEQGYDERPISDSQICHGHATVAVSRSQACAVLNGFVAVLFSQEAFNWQQSF